jgi:predicted amidophosphoribosyltransferase
VKYNFAEIEAARLSRWEGDDYYVLSYPPKRRKTVVTDLILDFKNNDDEALAIASRLIIAALRKIESVLQKSHCKYIVSIPSSTAGKENGPCEHVCREVEREFIWVKHLPNALIRTKTVPKAAYAKPGNRPTYDDHRATIDYSGTVHANTAFIMLDDVLTQGTVSQACRDILLENSKCQKVIGVLLGRTE